MARECRRLAVRLEIRSRGYFVKTPGINQRVVDETAAVVEYVNDLSE
jgi:hypothetical protein